MADLGKVDDKTRKGESPSRWMYADNPAMQTDAEIAAAGRGTSGRTLERWVPEGPDPAISNNSQGRAATSPGRGGDSDTFGTASAGGWDQFETNKRMFGGDSTYDENIYTTRLDRSAPDYKVKLKEAERLAQEIQNVSRAPLANVKPGQY